LFPQLLSRGSVDVPTLLAEVTQSWEAATVVEVAHIAAMLVAETSAWEASTMQDSATLRVMDAED
jgi:hypothetical protein